MATALNTGPYLPRFEHDIFLSYRHIDAPPDPWIEQFCDKLARELTTRLNRVDIWRDTSDLRFGDNWNKEIEQAVSSAAIFIAVLTENYLDSVVCAREFDLYLRRSSHDASNGVESVVVPVLRHALRSLPDEFASYHYMRIFDKESGLELDPGIRAQEKGGFYHEVAVLGVQLVRRLQELAGILQQGMTPLFLASMGYGADDRRTDLLCDLLQHDEILVLPEKQYIWSAPAVEQRLSADLSRAQLCVHIIPPRADEELSGILRKQLERAAKAMKQAGRPMPLVWIPTGAEPHEEVRELVDYVHDELADEGVEYLDGDSIEKFKTLVYDKLRELRSAPVPTMSNPAPAKLAVVIGPGDLVASGELTQSLSERIDRDSLRIKIESAAGLAAHAEALAECSGCLVIWGGVTEDWIQAVLDAKALSVFRERSALGLCLAGAESDDKATFHARRVHHLRMHGDDFETSLRAFVAAAEKPS